MMNKNSSNFKSFFFGLLLILLSSVLLILLINTPLLQSGDNNHKYISLDNLDVIQDVVISKNNKLIKRNEKCTYYDCFNVYRCNHGGYSKLLIYIYPIQRFVDEKNIPVGNFISKEYYEILSTIEKSEYFTSNPKEACIFVPSIDTLNQNRFRLLETSYALTMLPHWKGGENHLIFNMISGSSPDYSSVIELYTGKSMIIGADFNTWTYRPTFDLSIPVFSSISELLYEENELNEVKNRNKKPPWLILSSQININPEYMTELKQLAKYNTELVVLDICEHDRNSSLRCLHNRIYKYPFVLKQSTFCIVMRGSRLGQKVFHEAMAAGCIPIVIADTYVLPFQEVIDWKRALIHIPEAEISSIIEVIKNISEKHIQELRNQIKYLYNRYFRSISSITNTVLDVLNQRVFAHLAQPYEYWNIDQQNPDVQSSPLFLQMTSPRWQGFTAVILTYDRLQSLYLLMEKLSKVPSVSKIVIIWNNQKKNPPALTKWPKISKNWTIIRTNENKLSKRFYPYSEIETEAVLSIDDDITMLTTDELEFGFEVWCEFPDRIVGFPSRTHVYDNVTNMFKYDSEWKNQISMVLTGAAFYHKYWNYMYTTQMPPFIKQYVDDHMNCEDIAMNFLISNVTNKSPIKVTPKKKFKCPKCKNTELLSADQGHMVERTKCINLFTSIYGKLTLKSVEFRADPVLFKDNFPKKLKRFNDIGSL